MTIEKMVAALSSAAAQLGLTVRHEAGNFRGGLCVMNHKQVIVLNKNHPAETQFNILAQSLRLFEIEDLYLKPAVRNALEEAWVRAEKVDLDMNQ